MADLPRRIRNSNDQTHQGYSDLVAIVEAYGQPCYLVRFDDGKTDVWPIRDPTASYHFMP